jgi:hypothetical protein
MKRYLIALVFLTFVLHASAQQSGVTFYPSLREISGTVELPLSDISSFEFGGGKVFSLTVKGEGSEPLLPDAMKASGFMARSGINLYGSAFQGIALFEIGPLLMYRRLMVPVPIYNINALVVEKSFSIIGSIRVSDMRPFYPGIHIGFGTKRIHTPTLYNGVPLLNRKIWGEHMEDFKDNCYYRSGVVHLGLDFGIRW